MVLTPQHEHLLGVVDGELGEEELGFIAGLDPAQVGDILNQLAGHGLVSFKGSQPPSERGAEVVEQADLSVEFRAEIDHWYGRLGSLNHYQLLDVRRDADKGAVKKAYYRLAPRFHPDKHFRKDLGPYKARIEAIFSALTRSHDTLRYAKRRANYDATLPANAPCGTGASIAPLDSEPHSGDAESGRNAVVPQAPRMPDFGEIPAPRRSRPTPRMPEPAEPATPRRARPTPRVPDDVDMSSSRRGRPTPRMPLDDPRIGSQARDPNHVTRVDPSQFRRRRPSIAPPSAVGRNSEVNSSRRDALRRKLAGHRSVPPPASSEPGRDMRRDRPTPLSEPRGGHPSSPRGSAAVGSTASDEALLGGRAEASPYRAVEGVGQSAAEQLRDRFSQIGDKMRERRLRRYLSSAESAMLDGDYRTALAAYEQALRLAPDDAELADKARQAQRLARGCESDQSRVPSPEKPG